MKTNIRFLKVLYIFLLIAVYNPLLANTMPGTEKITSQNQGVYNMSGDISFKLVFPFGGAVEKSESIE